MYNKVQTTLRLNEQTKTAIEDISIIEHRSFNSMVEHILELYILDWTEKLEDRKDLNPEEIKKNIDKRFKQKRS